jgi:hypothetical protein
MMKSKVTEFLKTKRNLGVGREGEEITKVLGVCLGSFDVTASFAWPVLPQLRILLLYLLLLSSNKYSLYIQLPLFVLHAVPDPRLLIPIL